MIEKVISGGQTGVDRAALDAARKVGVPCGGWCPKGRKSEDGRIPGVYPLQETPSADYDERTSWNVRDSDGTLVLHAGKLGRGTRLTVRLAEELGKPCLVLDLSKAPSPADLLDWTGSLGVRTLNVAGPRESTAAGVHRKAWDFLMAALGADGKTHKLAV